MFLPTSPNLLGFTLGKINEDWIWEEKYSRSWLIYPGFYATDGCE